MATIELIEGLGDSRAVARYRAKLKKMAPGVLLAQDVMLRGATEALQTTLDRGCTREAVVTLQNHLWLCLGMVHGTAKNRGFKLPRFELPRASQA